MDLIPIQLKFSVIKTETLHTVNHQEKFYFPDEGLQAKIRDDLKEGKSSGMLFELSEDEFCSLDLDDPKLNGPQGNLFLLQQLKKLEDDSATLKLQNAVNEKMNSVIYDTSDNTPSWRQMKNLPQKPFLFMMCVNLGIFPGIWKMLSEDIYSNFPKMKYQTSQKL